MRRIRGNLLFRLIAGHVFLHACMAGTRMAVPLLALSQGHSALAVGILLALFSLTQVFLALPAGRFADRRGLRPTVGWSVVVAISGVTLALWAPVFPMLCVAALASGGATGAASIALQRHVGRAAANATELKRVFSWLAIGPALSNFLGPLLAGLLIDHAGSRAGDVMGYRAAFLLMALLPLVTWMLVRSLHEDQEPHRLLPDAPAGTAWDLLADIRMRRLMIVNWCLASCWDVHTFVVPVIGHERGFSASVIGSILGAFAMAAAVVRLLMPLVAARLREHVVITGAMVTTSILFTMYPWVASPWGMGACSVLLGFALGSVQPMVMSTLHQITPSHRQGVALGLRLMAINATSVAMPVLFGTVGAMVGVSVVFWTVAAVVGAGARPAWRLRVPPSRS